MSASMHNINPLTALRSLKGAPLSCLIALMFANQPVGKEWLARVTGYSDKPVSAAMDYLLEMGFVIHGGRCDWRIHHDFYSLPLANPHLISEVSRKNSDFLPTTTALIVDSINTVENAVAVKEVVPSIRDNSESIHLMKLAGIGNPTLTQLANQDHVTPYYVLAHTLQAKKEKKTTGLLIHRMKSKDPASQLNQNYHLLDCKCQNCFYFIYQPDKGLLEEEEFDFEEYLKSLQKQ
jgi:hypothetical protein